MHAPYANNYIPIIINFKASKLSLILIIVTKKQSRIRIIFLLKI